MAPYAPLAVVTVLELLQCHTRLRTVLALRNDSFELLTELSMPSG
jgi:hypothetical protein